MPNLLLTLLAAAHLAVPHPVIAPPPPSASSPRLAPPTSQAAPSVLPLAAVGGPSCLLEPWPRFLCYSQPATRYSLGREAPADTAHAPNYSTAALEALVAMASRRNSVVPIGLDSYQVSAESELSALFRRPDGTEGATQIEQMASALQWRRSGEFSQHIIGYQAELSGPNLSVLGFLKQSWIVPVLYGNRLGLFLGRDTTHTARRAIARDTAVRVVHPFARDRDSIYRFSGGDTAVKIHVDGQSIPIVRIHVQVQPHLRRRTVVFEGDIYVDAVDGEIVRMRGTFDAIGGHASLAAQIQGAIFQGQVFIDLTNRSVEGYWLPNNQRLEAAISSPFLGETQSLFRIVTHFDAYALNGSTGPAPAVAGVQPGRARRDRIDSAAADTLASDTLRALPHRLTIAPADSLAQFSGWHTQIGDATGAVRVEDFNDLALERWRKTGPPDLSIGARSPSDFVRFDKVEGLYTGLGLTLNYRDAAPGLISRANVGWAWTEHTVRGGFSTEWRNSSWRIGVSAARILANTNDFRGQFTSGPFLEALVAEDNYDYVDRRLALLSVRHDWWHTAGGIALTVNGGVSDDHGEITRLDRGLLPPVLFTDSIFRPNRNVLEGSYVIGGVTLAINPAVDASFVGQGLGVQLHYEVAGGQLAWQRGEARAVLRKAWGSFTTLAQVDGGIVTGAVIPPQQMFEIGLTEGLLAYNYKQFGGDQAAIWEVQEMYALPVWRAPFRIAGLVLPGPSPSLSLGFQSGWAATTTAAGREALLALGSRVNPATNQVLVDSTGTPIPASSPTNGVRTSINFLIHFFGGALGFGVAHSLDPGAKWQSVVVIGSAF